MNSPKVVRTRAASRAYKAEKIDFEALKGQAYRELIGRRNALDFGRSLNFKRKRRRDSSVDRDKGHQQHGLLTPSMPPILSRHPSRDGGNESNKRKFSLTPRKGDEGGFGLTDEQIGAFREVFDLLDSNGGGTIDAMELDETLRAVDIHLAQDELFDILSNIDMDGNGEIDFEEFLHLMTSMEQFLACMRHEGSDGPPGPEPQRESILFEALTEFMKKAALNNMDEIVGYYHTKARRFQAPHVVGHYAAGARLIGLTEKQLYAHLETLKINAGKIKMIKSPYAQPLPMCTSITNMRTNKLMVKTPNKPRRKGKIKLKVNFLASVGRQEGDKGKRLVHHHKVKPHNQLCDQFNLPVTHDRRGCGWVSQRTEHLEVKLPPLHLKQLGDFDVLTAEDLPAIREQVMASREEYSLRRRAYQYARNLLHWQVLDTDLITPKIIREHFRAVFSHYSSVPVKQLVMAEDFAADDDPDNF